MNEDWPFPDLRVVIVVCLVTLCRHTAVFIWTIELPQSSYSADLSGFHDSWELSPLFINMDFTWEVEDLLIAIRTGLCLYTHCWPPFLDGRTFWNVLKLLTQNLEKKKKKKTPWKSNDWWEDCLARRNQCSHHLDANQSQYFHLKGAILLQRIMIVRSDYLHHHGLFLEDEGWSEMCSNHLAIVGKWTYNSWILFYKVLLLISMYISDRRASQTCFIVLQSSLNMC